jgi:hypothetical protein
MGKAKTVADAARRQLVQSHEILRRSYLYLARNETVPARVSTDGRPNTLGRRESRQTLATAR